MLRVSVGLVVVLFIQGCGSSSSSEDPVSGSTDPNKPKEEYGLAQKSDPCQQGKPFFMDRCWDELHLDVSSFGAHSAFLTRAEGETLPLFKIGEVLDPSFEKFINDQSDQESKEFLPLLGCFLDNDGTVLGGCTVNLDSESWNADEGTKFHVFEGSITTEKGKFSLPIEKNSFLEVFGDRLDYFNYQYLEDDSMLTFEYSKHLQVITMWPTAYTEIQ